MAGAFHFAPLEPAAGAAAPLGPREALARAQADADQLREAARAEGLEAGRAEALAALGPAADALYAAVASAREDAAERAARLEAQAADLALAVAEKIVASAVAVEPERVLDAIRGALRALTDRGRVTVLVNPADLELVRAALGDVTSALGGVEQCDVQAERRVGRGGAVVRTPEGDLDASVESKLERVREVVEAALAPEAA